LTVNMKLALWPCSTC